MIFSLVAASAFAQSLNTELIETLPLSARVAALASGSSGGGLQLVGGAGGRILTSPDGSTWTLRNTGSISQVPGLAYGNGRHVAVCEPGEIFSSADGITWAKQDFMVAGPV